MGSSHSIPAKLCCFPDKLPLLRWFLCLEMQISSAPPLASARFLWFPVSESPCLSLLVFRDLLAMLSHTEAPVRLRNLDKTHGAAGCIGIGPPIRRSASAVFPGNTLFMWEDGTASFPGRVSRHTADPTPSIRTRASMMSFRIAPFAVVSPKLDNQARRLRATRQ
jgi:hypothetical protein